MIIIYVCHDQQSIDECNFKDPNAHILLVGPNNGISKFPSRLIILRDLPFNIEYERKLLTFTAWYAIVKNNLFSDKEKLCIVEWDITLPEIPEISTDIASFVQDKGHFYCNVNSGILDTYLHDKLGYKFVDQVWACTTNYILSRHVLIKFVEFYESTYSQIKNLDLRNLSWYHERIFWGFIDTHKFSITHITGAHHRQANTHSSFNR